MPRTSRSGQPATSQLRASKLAPPKSMSRRTRSSSRTSSVLVDNDEPATDLSAQFSTAITPASDTIEEEGGEDARHPPDTTQIKSVPLRAAPQIKDQNSTISAFEAVNELCKRTRDAEDKLTELQRENDGLLEELKSIRRREQTMGQRLRDEKKKAQDQHSRINSDMQKRIHSLESQVSQMVVVLRSFGPSAGNLLPLLNMLACDAFQNGEDAVEELLKNAEAGKD